ncbi:MAG: protein-L-isoaspartate(D-aspartate) O-methyltransferase [Chromatiales bacterium]
MNEQQFAALRQDMLLEIAAHVSFVSDQIGKGALDKQVIDAMGKVPRHVFVPLELQPYAYLNRPLPIGFEKTISQPFMVALMTDLLRVDEEDTILEIGTGLGYQAAILAELAHKVYSLEVVEELASQAMKRLSRVGYGSVVVKVANGYFGWPEHAPFDKIMVTAAPDLIPPPLINQLKPGGRMVIPAGLPDSQQLMLVEKGSNGRVSTKEILPVLFAQLEDAETG